MLLSMTPLVILALALAFVASGCTRQATLTSSRIQMGTFVTITATGPPGTLKEATGAAFERIEELEALLSAHTQTSELAAVCAAAGGEPVRVSPDVVNALLLALDVAADSGGALDPTCRPLVEAWGFLEGTPHIPSLAALEEALSRVGWQGVEVDAASSTVRLARAGMSLDLGAVAKGYIADAAAAVLRERGATGGIVEAGGDIACFGRREDGERWVLGLENPRGEGLLARIRVTDAGVATSGDYRRFFEAEGRRYSHIIDPRTGWPARGLASVTVIAETAAEADALATAAFVLGEEEGARLLERRGAGGIFIPDGPGAPRVLARPGISLEFVEAPLHP